MSKFKMLLTIVSIASATLIFCKVDTSTGPDNEIQTRTVKSLQITASEITPWSEDADGFREFANLSELTTIMNGGADLYYNRNAVNGFFQYLSNQINASTKYSVECRVMDFGTAENAKSMFEYKMTDVSTKQAAGNIALTEAAIDPDASLTGCTGYAHFGVYYFELQFTGYGSNKTEATRNAGSFIEVFKSKVQ